VNIELGNVYKEIFVACFKVLSVHFTLETEESYKKPYFR
jgi:hypothetical protein